jgi:acetyl-CoA synthetase
MVGLRHPPMHVGSELEELSIDPILCAGHRVDAVAVEHCLMEHPAVQEALAIGKPDALRGECVKAYVVLKAGFSPTEDLETELARCVEANLAAHASPREVEFVASLPRTATGAIERARFSNGQPKGVL